MTRMALDEKKKWRKWRWMNMTLPSKEWIARSAQARNSSWGPQPMLSVPFSHLIVTSWSWSIVTSGRDQYDENQQAAYFDKLCREPAPRVSSPVSPLQNTKSTRNSFRKAIPHPVPWHGIAGSPSPTKWERMQEKMRWSIKSKSDLLPTCSGGRGRKRTPPPSLLSRCWSKQACQKKVLKKIVLRRSRLSRKC